MGPLLRGEAEGRQPTSTELYGRELRDEELALGGLDEVNAAIQQEYATLAYAEALALWRAMHAQVVAQAARLTDEQLAAPGPAYPATWSRPQVAEVVGALVAHYEGHMLVH